MVRAGLAWEISPMPRGDVPKGVSAQLYDRLLPLNPRASVRDWCLAAKVSTSFFTDLRNGREPGIDKVERLVKEAGLSLGEFLEGVDPPPALSAADLEETIADAMEDLPLEAPRGAFPPVVAEAVRELLAQSRAGRVVTNDETARRGTARGTTARSRPPTTRSARGALRK